MGQDSLVSYLTTFAGAALTAQIFSGRQLFERNRHLEDESLMEEGTVSVDASQYERTKVDEEEESECVTFSDSD